MKVVSYNHRHRKFDNGICWYRLYVRIGGRWLSPGGLWHQGWRVRYLRPDRVTPR